MLADGWFLVAVGAVLVATGVIGGLFAMHTVRLGCETLHCARGMPLRLVASVVVIAVRYGCIAAVMRRCIATPARVSLRAVDP